MSIGKKIKQLRQERGITQETLADHLNLSFQAISKWENDNASPDISLLPQLSIYFGITIDDLFEISPDAHLERIAAMLDHQRDINLQDENYAKQYLTGLLENKKYKAQAHGLLAGLYNHRAKAYHQKASSHAEEALRLAPTVKAHHVNFVEANRGVFTDWNYTNHYKLCDFYQKFTQTNPQYRSGYLYHLDHLIADGRLTEAKEALTKLKSVDPGYIGPLYVGKIQLRQGNRSEAFETWNQMVDSFKEEWLPFACRADEYARSEQYELALQDYSQSMQLQPKPRYYDGFEAMAHIYEIQGNYTKAIEMWGQVCSVLEDEWNIKTGEGIDYPKREISRLQKAL